MYIIVDHSTQHHHHLIIHHDLNHHTTSCLQVGYQQVLGQLTVEGTMSFSIQGTQGRARAAPAERGPQGPWNARMKFIRFDLN